jgi:sporulation protein YlmC with PRC-barrel domain
MSIRTSLSLAVAVALMATGASYGQQASGVQSQRQSAQQNAQDADEQQPGAPQERSTLDQRSTTQRNQQANQERRAGYRGQTARSAHSQTLRLSEIMDMDVRNAQDEDLGAIEDVVVDPKSGQIRYAAVSVGGFLGVGDRLIAVPWQALRIQQEPNDDDKFVLLNADRARIENAPGFNEENWPDFGNQRYAEEVDTYYGSSSARESTTGTRSSTDQRSTNQFDSTRDNRSATDADSSIGTGTRSGTGTDTENRAGSRTGGSGTGTRSGAGSGAGTGT